MKIINFNKMSEMALCTINKIQSSAKINSITKTICVFIVAIIAVVLTVSLSQRDIYGESRLSTMEYIGVERAIKHKDYAKAQKILKEMQNDSDIYNSDKEMRLYKRYVTYYAACYAFDNGRYVEAYDYFDEIKGFRDVDSFYDRDEYKLVLHKDYIPDLQ